MAGMASFQLSLEKTSLYKARLVVATDACGPRLCAVSRKATYDDIMSLRTSFNNTAVEVKYLFPSTNGMILE